jgi:hypothetical protein
MWATVTDPGWWLLCICTMDLLRICTTTPDVGGLLSRSWTSAQGAPESSRILIVVVSLELYYLSSSKMC